jgi:hypothetical protein
MRRLLQTYVFLSLFTVAVGCESKSDNGRLNVTGSVTFAGQPIEEGQIIFEPEAPGAPLATGQIKVGKYEIEPKYGPAAGSYRVRIEGYRKKKVANMPPHPYAGNTSEPGVIAEQFLPAAYNTRTTLRVEIGADKENVHDFNLKPVR